MKKVIFLVICSLLCGTDLLAQYQLGPIVSIGSGKFVYGESAVADTVSSGNMPAMQLGIRIGQTLPKPFSLQSEVGFRREGRKMTHISGLEHTEYNNFATGAALLRITKKGYSQSFYLESGPRLSYWLSGHGQMKGGEIEVRRMEEPRYRVQFATPTEITADDFYAVEANRVQVALEVGIGTQFSVGHKQSVDLSLRYSSGHTQLGDNVIPYYNLFAYQPDQRGSNRSLSLKMAYLFDFDLKDMKKGKSTFKQK